MYYTNSIPKEEEILGTATTNLNATGSVDFDFNRSTIKGLQLVGNVQLNLTNLPTAGNSVIRTLMAQSLNNETLAFPNNAIVSGTYDPDVTKLNRITIESSHFGATKGALALITIENFDIPNL